MTQESGTGSPAAPVQQRTQLARFRHGRLASFLTGHVLEVRGGDLGVPGESQQTLLAARMLQYAADYRAALQDWFHAVAVGGHLVIVVPHAFLHERQLTLPSRWDAAQRRLYTPRSLLDEVEEALTPNSYRVRFLSDDDGDYDYALPIDQEPDGPADILLVLEKITPPVWELAPPLLNQIEGAAPDYAFEAQRTRVEAVTLRERQKILIIKLDHLGDLILGLPALEKARAVFADAEITLVVGSWNAGIARESGVANRVITFDAFPRNSSEEMVDVHARAALFQAVLPGEYDLAIDLRVDHDTRGLLMKVDAKLRAGIGTRAQFPFLDIFLPIDCTRNEPETAREDKIDHHSFRSQGAAFRNEFRVTSLVESVERHSAVIWGPYWRLRAGSYVFEPYIEVTAETGGALELDIAIDAERVAAVAFPTVSRPRLHFDVQKAAGEFEFRVWTMPGAPSLDFNFYGGRLVRKGAESVLHQSEYMSLLMELIRIRLDEHGVLGDAAVS